MTFFPLHSKFLWLQVYIIISPFSFLDGYSQITLIQTPLSVTREETKTARMRCKISGEGFNFDSAYIHWYRQSPRAAPKRILYTKSGSVFMDEDFDKEKFKASDDVPASTSNLRVEKLTQEDAAIYYCATWDITINYDIKVFGSGTKLVVSSTPAHLNSATMQVLSPSTEQDEKVSYMCLIENFHPNVIKVTWEDENKNEEKNGVHEEIWPPGDNQQSYSLSSWLTVDKNSGKNYRCKYEHEIKGDYVPMESPGIYYIIKTSSLYIFREVTVSLQ
uniref:Ig-like domain-containing protein n=1 Tax=Gopherus agassizii TaxID=38772 RepID=A0A452IHZ3_9SAUR